ncbi:MAG: hypothetical protein ACXVZT_05710, partial [Terriglobales bacterium]
MRFVTVCADLLWSNESEAMPDAARIPGGCATRVVSTATFCPTVDWREFGAMETAVYRRKKNPTAAPRLWLSALVLLVTLASASQVTPSTAEKNSPDLNLILQCLEKVGDQNPSQPRPYEVTREYKLFHGSDEQPTSEVMAQIDFVPPDMKTYKILQ